MSDYSTKGQKLKFQFRHTLLSAFKGSTFLLSIRKGNAVELYLVEGKMDDKWEKHIFLFFFFSGRRHSYVIMRKLNRQHCNDVTQKKKNKYIKQLCSLDCNLLTCKWYRKRLVLGSVTA